jgi:hypothetical protein
LQNNPGALKRYRLFASHVAIPYDQLLLQAATNFSNIAWYALTGFEEGIRYIVHLQQTAGRSTRRQVWEGLAISFFHSGPNGSEVIARALRDYEWLDPDEPADYGEWNSNAHLLSSGLDFADPSLSREELDRLEAWYLRMVGDIPAYVRFLAKYRPAALKAYRNRYEHLVSSMPAQLVPLAAIKINGYRANAELLRENVLLARSLGVSKEDTLMVATSGAIYGHMETLSMVERVAGDLFDSWPEDVETASN